MLARRQFAYTVMGLIVFGSSRWTAAIAADPRVTSRAVSLEGPLSRDVFRALVREPFSLLLDNRAATLLLLRVDDAGGDPDTEQFTLVFQGPRNPQLLDGTYLVTHVTAGTTLLYLRPTGSAGRYRYYDAPFNLLRDLAGASGAPSRP